LIQYGTIMLSITEFVVTVLVFLCLGRYADSYFSTGSRLMTIGAITGFVLGVIRMTLRLKSLMGDDSDKS